MCEQFPDDLNLHALIQSLLTPAVTRHLPPHWQHDFSKIQLSKWIQARDLEASILLAIEIKSRKPIGFLTLFESTEAPTPGKVIRLGYVLAEEFWGRGIATELVRGFTEWAKPRGIIKIVAGVDVHNPGSMKVLEKSGFKSLKPDSGQNPGERFFELCMSS